MDYQKIIRRLKSKTNPKNVEGMAKFGIRPNSKVLGISIYEIRKIAKEIGTNHQLAIKLWNSKLHEAKLLAGMVDDPRKVTDQQMETWVKDFDSWDIVDQTCSNLIDKTPMAYRKAFEWPKRDKEFVKRAGFVLMATLSVHDKKASDAKLEKFFPVILDGATDERNFVKKAVNWALRQIGKRNKNLNKKAIKLAKEIEKIDSKSARWIAKDALRELTGERMQNKFK